MSKLPKTTLVQRAIAGALAGIVGGACHAVVNEIDRRVLRHNADDLTMLGGMITDNHALARKIGTGVHFGIAISFGAAYATILHPRDEDDAMKKAVGAAMVENFGLYPLVFPLEDMHPYIRDGRLDRFAHPIALVQATLRHLALGIGIGKAYPAIVRMVRK
jgi:hypothetical protein